MSEKEPIGLYVYQPFGTVTHPHRTKTGRLYGVGGLPYMAKCEGLTYDEADAIVAAINALEAKEPK